MVSELDICPGCGGVADNGFDRCVPPSAYFCTKCNKTSYREESDKAWVGGIMEGNAYDTAFAQGYREGSESVQHGAKIYFEGIKKELKEAMVRWEDYFDGWVLSGDIESLCNRLGVDRET